MLIFSGSPLVFPSYFSSVFFWEKMDDWISSWLTHNIIYGFRFVKDVCHSDSLTRLLIRKITQSFNNVHFLYIDASCSGVQTDEL